MDTSRKWRRELQFIQYELLAYQCWVACIADRSHEYDSARCQADTSSARRSHSPSPLAASIQRLAKARSAIANIPFPRSPQTANMGYEDSVYLAKLAEQAERYEG